MSEWKIVVGLVPPTVAFVVMSYLWYTRGRDPKPGAVPVQYEPPAGLTPAEVGVLIDHSLDPRDGIATLVDLAHHGYVAIEPAGEARGDGKPDYLFRLLIPAARWKDLKRHEQAFLEAFFFNTLSPALRKVPEEVYRLKRGQREMWLSMHEASFASMGSIDPQALPNVKLSEQQSRVSPLMPLIAGHVIDRLVARGYYRTDPDKVRARYWNYFVRGVLLLFFGGFFMLALTSFVSARLAAVVIDVLARFGPMSFVSALLTIAVVAVFAQFMPTRSPLGTRILRHILGFQEFLRRVEADRFKRMVTSPAKFEEYLAYAMVLGVDKSWAQAFDSVYESPMLSEDQQLAEVRKILQLAAQIRQTSPSAPRVSTPRRPR